MKSVIITIVILSLFALVTTKFLWKDVYGGDFKEEDLNSKRWWETQGSYARRLTKTPLATKKDIYPFGEDTDISS